MTDDHAPAHALLLVAPGCPHCSAVLDRLATLVKDGALGRMEVVNIASEPEVAQTHGVRSIPWIRIGPFELAGLHTLEELRRWTALAGQDAGMTRYLAELLATGRRAEVTRQVSRDPTQMARLAELIGDPETELGVRIGVMATLEELQEKDLLAGHAERFIPLARHPQATVRADACHALTLIGGSDVLETLRQCAGDTDPVVREAAMDGIEYLTLADESSD